jgi:hypothetical protein
MPRFLGIRPVGRWEFGWRPPERPREGFYLCACGHVHDDNGDRPPEKIKVSHEMYDAYLEQRNANNRT